MTLPETTLRQLEAVDRDRARAIVKLAGHRCPGEEGPSEILSVQVGHGHAVILVGPMTSVARIELLRLVEVAPGRHLLTIPPGTAIDSLEVAIADLLETLPAEEEAERPQLEKLHLLLGQQRRKKGVHKRELLLISE